MPEFMGRDPTRKVYGRPRAETRVDDSDRSVGESIGNRPILQRKEFEEILIYEKDPGFDIRPACPILPKPSLTKVRLIEGEIRQRLGRLSHETKRRRSHGIHHVKVIDRAANPVKFRQLTL